MWVSLEGGETHIEPDLNIFRGTMALSPKYFSQATNTIVMTPAKKKKDYIEGHQNVTSVYICTIGGTDDDNGLVVPRLGISAPLQSERDTGDRPSHQNGPDKV